MDELLLEASLRSATARSVSDVLTLLLLSLLLGAVVAAVYRLRANSRGDSSTMTMTLVLLAMISAMVMVFIGDSLARAFSLVGALAIVRFRTRLRSPVDITFVFFALAVGIGCGVGAANIALAGTGLISMVALGLGWRTPPPAMVLRCDVAAHEGVEAKIAPLLTQHVQQMWLQEARTLRFGETISYRYTIHLHDGVLPTTLLSALSIVEGVERAVLTTDPDRIDSQD